jgi:transposase InsO family protein
MLRVRQAVQRSGMALPFPLRELHTDNGSEFINQTLNAWCKQHRIRFTRGRGYRKNDQAYVEQRNWLAVRGASSATTATIPSAPSTPSVACTGSSGCR